MVSKDWTVESTKIDLRSASSIPDLESNTDESSDDCDANDATKVLRVCRPGTRSGMTMTTIRNSVATPVDEANNEDDMWRDDKEREAEGGRGRISGHVGKAISSDHGIFGPTESSDTVQ